MLKKINIIVWLLCVLQTACQDTTKTMEREFDWEETLSCPPGYPIRVYRGGLFTAKGSFTSLYLGTHTGQRGWGATGRSMSSGIKSVPDSLAVTWVSFAEDSFYEINTKLDKEKITELFSTPYPLRNADGTLSNERYGTIVVGMAPGGVVVVWLEGAGRQTEVGRYQGKKVVIPQEEIAKLDNHDQLIFDPEYRKKTMLRESVVPKTIQEAHKGKPLPYGLWDSYRQRYNWVPDFEIQNEGSMRDVTFEYYNGEMEKVMRETLPVTDFGEKPIPNGVGMGWKDKEGQNYGGYVDFNEESVFKAFQEIYKSNPKAQARLEIRVNMPNTYITVLLVDGEKEIVVKTDKVVAFRSLKKY